MEEVKAWSKELADGSVENDVQEHYIENSVKAAVLIQKLCEHFGLQCVYSSMSGWMCNKKNELKSVYILFQPLFC